VAHDPADARIPLSASTRVPKRLAVKVVDVYGNESTLVREIG
jgi:hypothetical protein